MRLHRSGVCHSDWNTVTGDTPSPLPAVLGHEGAGVVESVGEGVTTVAPGDHVVLSWLPACGRCGPCVGGRPSLCESATPALLAGTLLDGTTRLSLDGKPIHHYSFLSTFAESTVVPEASCVPIRPDAPFDIAALVGCAVMTGIGAVLNRAMVRTGSSVVVFGAGGVGLSAIQACGLVGASTVIAVDPAEERRQLAIDLGATHALDPTECDPVEAVRDLTAGSGADYGFEASGARGDGRHRVARGLPGRHAGVHRHPAAGSNRGAARGRAGSRREDRDRKPVRVVPPAPGHADGARPVHGWAGSISTGSRDRATHCDGSTRPLATCSPATAPAR